SSSVRRASLFAPQRSKKGAARARYAPCTVGQRAGTSAGPVSGRCVMPHRHRIHRIEDYERFVGAATIDRIRKKADSLRGLRVTHINSTFYGGGVAELLSSLTLLMGSTGIQTGWRAIHGPPDFFSITKKMHNALQGEEINLTRLKTSIYEDVV